MKYVLPLFAVLVVTQPLSAADAVYLAEGIKIGEVTSNSAIVWVRTTASKVRNNNGRHVVGRPARAIDENPVMSQAEVNQLEGAVPGAPGEVRVTWSPDGQDGQSRSTKWRKDVPDKDDTLQVTLNDLLPDTHYRLKVDVRPVGGDAPTATMRGKFRTAGAAEKWQDVKFAVTTCQAYKDLDDPAGFKIYSSILKTGIDFHVATGDTVYYDSEAPRARNEAMARYHWQRIYSLPRLIEFHRQVPSYWEKDDHDTLSNDSWPGRDSKMMLPLTWEEGKALFREQVPMGEKTYRTVRWGKGLQIWLVEGRDFRSPNNMNDGPEKTIWGAAQREWLMSSILASDADFKVLISPTPIVGPDRTNKRDNHSNKGFTWEGDLFRNWTKEHHLTNLIVCCGDRHWQYHSVHPATGLQEFCVGPASDEHAGGTPGRDMMVQPFHRVKGGFLTVTVSKDADGKPQMVCEHHDVDGKVVYRYQLPNDKE